MSKDRTVITLLTWNRLEVTKQTLLSFSKYNKRHDLLAIDNGSTDGTPEWLSSNGYEVIRNNKNEGIFLATKKAWEEAAKRGYEFILNLQNDFPCLRKIPFSSIENYLDQNKDVGFVLLNDKSSMLKYKSNGKVVKKTNNNRRNKVTEQKIVFDDWQVFEGHKFRKGNHHFTFNPTIFSTKLVEKCISVAEKQRELGLMLSFDKLKMRSAHLDKKCFETILRPREKNWSH